MRSTLSRLAGLLALALAAALPGTAAAQTCGDTITSSFTLTADLHCDTGWIAFYVAAGGITIRLNGHTLSGTNDLAAIGLNDASNVRIVGPGRIRGFWVGANVFRSPNVRIQNVVFEDMDAGVILTRSQGALVTGNQFNRIAGNAVLINDSLFGESRPSGNNRIAGNRFDDVDVAVRACGVTAGGNLIERNAITRAHSAGIRLTDHSGSNYVSRNRMTDVWAGVRIDASRGNTVIDNVVSNSTTGVYLPADLDGQCVTDPSLGTDNGDHKIYDNRIINTGIGFWVGNDVTHGRVFRIAFGGNRIHTATTGFLLDTNTVRNYIFGTTWFGVGEHVLDYGTGNRW